MGPSSIPRSALVLGIAGLIPFVWGVITLRLPGVQDWAVATLGARFVGPYVILYYGTIILAFMSGVLWGLATRAKGEAAALGYSLSTVPALWAFFFTGTGPVSSAINLAVGFLGVLGIDWVFARNGLAPEWWMTLRVPLTIVVVTCLAVVALG
jgi:hypothetical protein